MTAKNTGEVDFTGQPGRDEPGTEEPGQPGVRINKQAQKNKYNGSGGTRRVIAPGSVRGSNGT